MQTAFTHQTHIDLDLKILPTFLGQPFNSKFIVQNLFFVAICDFNLDLYLLACMLLNVLQHKWIIFSFQVNCWPKFYKLCYCLVLLKFFSSWWMISSKARHHHYLSEITANLTSIICAKLIDGPTICFIRYLSKKKLQFFK